MECDNRFYLYTGHKFLCTISSTSVTIKKSPLSNFRIVSEQGRTKDLKTQNWQLYKSPERASAVSTNIWGDQPSRRSGSGFIVFGSEAWVPVTSLCVWKSISCLLSLIPKICLSFSCSSSVQHQESLGLFGLIVHGSACFPIYKSGVLTEDRDHIGSWYCTNLFLISQVLHCRTFYLFWPHRHFTFYISVYLSTSLIIRQSQLDAVAGFCHGCSTQ